MSSKPPNARSKRPAAPGGAPLSLGGPTRGVAWTLSAVLVVAVAALAYALRVPLTDQWQGGLPAFIQGSGNSSQGPTPESTGLPVAETVAQPPEKKVVAVPKAPSWSLVQVGEAVQNAVPALQALIAEGRAEVPELRGMSSKNKAKAERAQRRWEAWGQIWRNRVQVVETSLPPTEACAVHASMEPACLILREAVETLESVADGPEIGGAMDRFELTEGVLDRYLNPPEPEPLPEDDVPEDDAAPEGDGSLKDEAGEPTAEPQA